MEKFFIGKEKNIIGSATADKMALKQDVPQQNQKVFLRRPREAPNCGPWRSRASSSTTATTVASSRIR